MYGYFVCWSHVCLCNMQVPGAPEGRRGDLNPQNWSYKQM